MDRTVSAEEKIRRAEEIYYRRKNQTSRNNVARVNVNDQKDYGLYKKLILQICICLVIYFIFYLIQNGNYLFSEQVINKTKEILSYDINIPQTYQQVKGFMQVSAEEQNETKQEDQSEPENEQQEQVENTNDTSEESQNVDNSETQNNTESQDSTENQEANAIGGAGFEDVVLEEPKSQEQMDIEYLQTLSWVKPISGRVTSEFGKRESTSAIVSSNHTGIDVAANTGTVIVAAMEGTVEVSSTIGEYGQHIKITNGDVSTLYAHCSKLYVNVGEHINQGQAIAEVGTTGNSTGPHLHFEVIRAGRYINPRNVLEF